MAVEKPSTIHCESPSADISGNEAQTTYSQLGREYYLSMQFIGSYLAAGVAFGYSLCAFNLIAPIMVQINQDIGPDPNYVWLSYIYTTTLAILSPIVGRLTDIFGRRYIFIALTLVGIVGLSVCATAQSIPVLIGGQVLVSISSTVGYSVVYIIGELVPVRYRYTFYAMIFIFAVPSTVGPAIAETLVHNYPGTTWRGVYYILIAMNVLSLVCWILFYFPPDFEMKHQTRKRRAFIANFDYIGLLLFAGGLVVLLFGLSCGGTIYAWKSAATICMIVAGFLTLVAFVLWERFAARAEPVIPWQIFRRRDFVATLTAVGFATSVFFSTAIIWPRQVTLLYSEGGYMRTGFLSSLPGLAQLAGQFIGGGISLPIGHHKFQLVAYFCISGTLYACLTLTNTHNLKLTAPLIFLANVFTGLVELIGISNVTILIDSQDNIGLAGGLSATFRLVASSIATVVYVTVLENRLQQTIPALVPEALTAAGLPTDRVEAFLQALGSGSVTALRNIPEATGQIIQTGMRVYKEANVEAYRTVYLVTIAFSVIGIAAACFTPNTEKSMSYDVAVTLKGTEKKEAS